MSLKDIKDRMQNQETPQAAEGAQGAPAPQRTQQAPPDPREAMRKSRRSLSFGDADDKSKMGTWMGGEILEALRMAQSTTWPGQLPKYWSKESRQVVTTEYNPDGSQNRALWDPVVALRTDSTSITLPDGRAVQTAGQAEDEDDSPERDLYLTGDRKRAVIDAEKAAGFKMQPGAYLYIAWVGKGDSKTFGKGRRRLYDAILFPPAAIEE